MMSCANYLGLAAALLLLLPAGAFAKEKSEHNLRLDEAVEVGSAQLRPGNYKVEWKGTGPAVSIDFLENGRTLLSTTGRVVEKDKPAEADEVMTRKTTTNQQRLEELDFGNRKEILLFAPYAPGM
jgi:hypothetical protein